MPREMIFSILVFIFSCSGVFFSYYTVVKQNLYDNTIVSNIAPGIFNYKIVANDKCIGSVNYELDVNNNISAIKSKGDLNVQYLTQKYSINYIFESSFNSIGQMGGTVLKINILDKYIVLGTINIDPIKLTFKSNLLDVEKEFSWSIAGPVELKKTTNELYYISGLSFEKIKKDNLKLLENNSIFSLPIRFINNSQIDCSQKKNEYFDITSYIESVKSLYSGVLN